MQRMQQSQTKLRRNAAQNRFEIEADGQLAGFIDYRERGDVLDLVHTQVEPAYEGQGLASKLAQFALDEARRSGKKVAPSCSYVARWMDRHPDYHDLRA
jgi:predicted GNAT family acetyltransferase